MHRADVVSTHNDYSPFPVTADFETLLDLKPLDSRRLLSSWRFRGLGVPGGVLGR